jgi:MarR family transcriptional regulator, negative regulator of the multidrug operon emrRAB
VDRLARDGLVERRRGADQRSAALFLTPAGRRRARRVLTRRDAEMHSVLALVTDGEQDALTRVARRVLGAAPEAEPRLCRLCDRAACGRRHGQCPVAKEMSARSTAEPPFALARSRLRSEEILNRQSNARVESRQ